jgi:oligoendopeptidase F
MVEFNIKDMKTSWNLKDYYTSVSDVRIDEDVKKVSSLVKAFISKYTGKITKLSDEKFVEFFSDENEYGNIVGRIQIFMLYTSSLDTQNQDILKKQDELSHSFTKIFNELTFVSQEFKARGFDDLIRLSELPALLAWKNYFFQTAQSIKYILDEKTEKALNFKASSGGKSAFSSLYEELTGSFEFKVHDYKTGKDKMVTDSEVRALRTSHDERVRKNAYESIRAVYEDEKTQIVLGNCYSNILKDCTSELNIRGYEHVMSRRNISEELSDEVVDTLLSEVEKSYPMYQKYLKIKAKLMGKDKLNVWDVMAPLDTVEKEYSFEDGLKLFLDTIKKFDVEFYDFSVNMFENSRVDVFPGKGKRGGAFACYDKGFESYVLLNWTNKLEDVSTLAHELGHATHGHLSQIQESEVYSTGMCLAETASVFNEMILSDTIMKTLSDREKLSYLDETLGHTFATIHRQIRYILFERRCHQAIYSGEGLGYEDFNKMWKEEGYKMSGDEILRVEGDKSSTWSSIPHIFRSPFYCYAYSFGNILTFALYNKYKEEEVNMNSMNSDLNTDSPMENGGILKKQNPFVPKYKEFLKSGGSMPPAELVMKTIGMDISKPEYYQSGLSVISGMLEEFEALSGRK